MGYTRYYNIKEGKKAFDEDYIREVNLVIRFAKEDYDIEVAGWNGLDEPLITDKVIALNGIQPKDFETLRIDLEDEGSSSFCKTQHRPYDAVVNAILQLSAEWGYVYDVGNDGETSGDIIATKILEKVRNTF